MPVTDVAFDALRDRVTHVEQRIAVRDETLKAIEMRLSHIEAILSRLTWLLVAGIGAAAVTFIINGGLRATGV